MELATTSSTASPGSSTTSTVDGYGRLGLNLDLDPLGIVMVGSLFSGMNEKISSHNLSEFGDRMTVVPATLVPMGGT